MMESNIKIFKHKRSTTAVAFLLIVAFTANAFPQYSQLLTKPTYHHVHHVSFFADEEKHADEQEFDKTSLPHHHGNDSKAHEHRHCHSHGPQVIDATSLSLELALLEHTAITQNIEQYFKHDNIKNWADLDNLFRPPILI